MSVGKSVLLFLADGTPGGLLTAEIMNWTGHVVAAPRSDLGALRKREESSRTGIYILMGEDPNSLGGTVAYIGEGDDISARLYEHSRPESQGGKDFWDRVIILTSKDANLTKAHARYLESRLITVASQAGRALLLNKQTPPSPSLPESHKSDMEYFITQAKIVLPVLGVNLLRSATASARTPYVQPSANSVEPATSPNFEMTLKKYAITATAQEVDGEFTVFEGSQARPTWSGADDGYKRLREKLDTDGTLALSEDGLSAVFTRNHVFASTSAAAAIVAGRSANGRIEWKTQDSGISYGNWQNRQVDETVEEVSA